MVGTPRSGTTLARAILTGHPDVEIPGETGFLPRLLQLRPLWWGRQGLRPRVFTRLACGNGRLARSGLMTDDVRMLVTQSPPSQPLDAISVIFDEFGSRAGKSVVGDKTPFYIDHLPRLMSAYPNAPVICMVRHPLDTISSLMTQPWGPNSALAAALQWDRSQRAAARASASSRVLTVRLEDLVADPENTVSAMAAHIGVERVPAMLEFAGRASSIADQNVHPSSHQGLRRDLVSTRDWMEHLSERQADQAWAIVRESAEALGYEGSGRAVRARRLTAWFAVVWFQIGRQRKRLVTIGRVLGR